MTSAALNDISLEHFLSQLVTWSQPVHGIFPGTIWRICWHYRLLQPPPSWRLEELWCSTFKSVCLFTVLSNDSMIPYDSMYYILLFLHCFCSCCLQFSLRSIGMWFNTCLSKIQLGGSGGRHFQVAWSGTQRRCWVKLRKRKTWTCSENRPRTHTITARAYRKSLRA